MPPGSVIGILGGGQLGRMIALAAAPMGYRCAVLTPEADSPASQVAWQTVVAPYDDAEALARFAGLSDVVTLEFENVPAATVTALAARVRTAPQDRVLAVTQDRLKEKTLARDAGLATVAFAAVDNGDLSAMTETIGFPAILKTRRMGYDGKGQRRVESLEAGREACRALGDSLIAEAVCPFDKELSVIVARSARGEIRAFDAVENEHENHILRTTWAPARVPDAVRQEAGAAACRLAERLSLVGLLAVEFFWSPEAGLSVNEMAPRPHNSGHWTIEACRTSQFEQLVRAICGLPLGDPGRRFDAVMTNILGSEAESWTNSTADPAAHLHLYGKAETRSGRKMGHVTRLLPRRKTSRRPEGLECPTAGSPAGSACAAHCSASWRRRSCTTPSPASSGSSAPSRRTTFSARIERGVPEGADTPARLAGARPNPCAKPPSPTARRADICSPSTRGFVLRDEVSRRDSADRSSTSPQDEGLCWLNTFSFILRRPLRRREAPSRNGCLEGRKLG